jgi:hypothetical protein
MAGAIVRRRHLLIARERGSTIASVAETQITNRCGEGI